MSAPASQAGRQPCTRKTHGDAARSSVHSVLKPSLPRVRLTRSAKGARRDRGTHRAKARKVPGATGEHIALEREWCLARPGDTSCAGAGRRCSMEPR